jgi:excisionase family DNA binding protein
VIVEGWITTDEAATLTGYSRAYIRRLANHGRVEARKIVRDWLISRQSLLAHKTRMETLGDQRHNPWREDLAGQERGRRKSG